MASTSANTFYARPVYLGGDKERHRRPAVNDTGQRSSGRYKHIRFSDIDTTPPPPRPPPPRPCRKPIIHAENDQQQNTTERRRQLPPTPHDTIPTPEPKPLTRTNVTSHEKLWQKDIDNENSGPSDILSPPLKYITPQTTEEMVRNFDPLDLIDSTSDHSDSSADTMIMMTTEEELKNQERINHSLKQYTSLKTKSECSDTNKSKANIQTKKNLHIHFADTNGFETDTVNGTDSDQTYSKVIPLHIRTDHANNGSSPESTSKPNSNHGSPNDSPDDGYGTNSSSGTVSSPFSSSFGSNDLENSYNGNSKKVILPNGAIKPNSVRESWAVKRKQRMIESSDNTVQDQLRELTIIEEEGSGNFRRRNSETEVKSRHGPNIVIGHGRYVESQKIVLKNGVPHDINRDDSASEPFVNVSPNDLRRVNRKLYVIDNDQISNGPIPRRHDRKLPPAPSSTNEINTAPCVPPHYNTLPISGNRNSDDVFMSGTEGVRNENGDFNRWDAESESSVADSMNSGPMLLRGGAEQRFRTASGSGKIYVSPSGDEGFYSLNRSSRSTSMSSFQPITEVSDPGTGVGVEQGNGPRSPLEVLNGDFLEKWSDMDMNYRNYYGFNDQVEKFSRNDSKVNYFQEKKINTMYGQDNYYRPTNYGSESALAQASTSQSGLGQGHSAHQGSTNQGIQGDSKDKHGSAPKPSTSRGQHKSGKEKGKDGGSSRSKIFQILPNMFKPSSKKQNTDATDSKVNTSKSKARTLPVTIEAAPVTVEHSNIPVDIDPEAEYINVGDLPQYSLAAIEYEEKLKKGQYVSLESLRKRPVFASSRDIKKLFSTHDQSFDSISSPGTQRHSFHAMPLSYRHQVSANQSNDDDMRPRAQSTSATMRSQQIRNSVESRMAVISRKNAAVMNQKKRGGHDDTNSEANLSFHSNTSSQRLTGSRKRLDSGNSGSSDSKLSTLV